MEQKLRGLNREDIALSSITMAELHYGAAHSKNRESNIKKVRIFCSSLTLCPFEEHAAEIFGEIKEILASERKMIGVMDLLIASIALAKKATLVTHNTREFSRIPTLKIEDWFE